MPFTTPKTWVNGSIVTATDLNTEIRDNITALAPGHQVLTTAQKNALTGVTTGTMVYDSTLLQLQIYNGSAWVSAKDLTYIGTASATSGTVINANNVFTSAYENYRLVGCGTDAANYASMNMQLRAGGTTATGANYVFGVTGWRANNLAYTNGVANTTSWQFPNMSIADRHGFSVDILKPALALRRTQISGTGNGQDITSEYSWTIGGSINDTTSFDGFTLNLGNTITELYVRIYGYRNS